MVSEADGQAEFAPYAYPRFLSRKTIGAHRVDKDVHNYEENSAASMPSCSVCSVVIGSRTGTRSRRFFGL